MYVVYRSDVVVTRYGVGAQGKGLQSAPVGRSPRQRAKSAKCGCADVASVRLQAVWAGSWHQDSSASSGGSSTSFTTYNLALPQWPYPYVCTSLLKSNRHELTSQ